MKKRILPLICTLLICIGALSLTLFAGAAGEACFLAVNDKLLDLDDNYMPIAVGGLYYVPYTVFDNTVTGVNLGVYPIVNRNANTLTLYSKQQMLTFDLDAGNCYDKDGVYSYRAIIRNGRTYLPARFSSEYFGLVYSSRTTDYAPLVRICSSSAVLDDNDFSAAASFLMGPRLTAWLRAQGIVDPPAVTPTPTPVPTVQVTPSPGADVTDKSGVRAYLGVRCEDGSGLDELLISLEQYRAKALFFFPADGLAQWDESIRQVLCGGHAVGLLVSGTTAEEIQAQAAEGNRLLAGIARLQTVTVLVDGGADSTLSAQLSDAGLLTWRGGISALPDGRTASRQAATVLKAAEAQNTSAWITLDSSSAGSVLAGRVLRGLVEDRYDLRLAVETEF